MRAKVAFPLVPILALFLVAGCQHPPTHEAIVFYTFQDTWSVAKTAYDGYAEQVVLGKVSKEKETQIDNAWNTFRASFKVAFVAASQGWNQQAPDDLRKMATELIAAIKAIRAP